MRFVETPLPGAWILELDPAEDERGFFARTFCAREFRDRGLVSSFVQCSLSGSRQRGTLRGLHYQRPPAAEVKVVRCVRGAIHDVIVDVRPQSPAYLSHFSVELSAANRKALYVPELCAHGFQTLENDSEVFYQISAYHAPAQAAGLRYDDPRLAIPWPLPVTVISRKDQTWPWLSPQAQAPSP